MLFKDSEIQFKLHKLGLIFGILSQVGWIQVSETLKQATIINYSSKNKISENSTIIEFFPSGIFTSTRKYRNSVVELTTKKVDLGK